MFLHPQYSHPGYCITAQTWQTEVSRGRGCSGDGAGGSSISPNACLADGLLVLGKITSLVIGYPKWLYYLHGRAFIRLQALERAMGERKLRGWGRKRERQAAFRDLAGASGDSWVWKMAQSDG